MIDYTLLEKVEQEKQAGKLASVILSCVDSVTKCGTGSIQHFGPDGKVYCCLSKNYYCPVQMESTRSLKECNNIRLYREAKKQEPTS